MKIRLGQRGPPFERALDPLDFDQVDAGAARSLGQLQDVALDRCVVLVADAERHDAELVRKEAAR